MRTSHRVLIAVIVLVALVAALSGSALATSQWSRKYGMSCRTCHSSFPRLNYYGQRFMRNGYQNPDSETPDGDETGKKKLNDMTFIDKLGHFFGVRLSATPVQYTTNQLVDADTDKVEDRLSFGGANWVQFFVAGSIAQNTSIFIEMAFEDREYHYSWYKLGFHNIGGTSLGNLIVGNVPAREYGAYPNRLRIFGPVTGDVFGIKSAQGTNKDNLNEKALNISGSRPALQYYGYQGPVVVWGGVSPGDNGDDGSIFLDLNDKIHWWGGVRLEATEDMGLPIEGSAISAWYYNGKDTASEPDGRHGFGPVLNEYTRKSVEAEIRAGDFEVMAAYVMGEDDNWDLTVDAPLKIEFSGFSVVGGYMQEVPIGLLHYGLQYDSITSDDVPGLEVTYVTPSISFFPRENVRIGLYGRIDMTDGRDDDEKVHDIILNVRTMF